MATLTEKERVSLLMMRGWGDRVRSYDEVVDLFNETFREGQVQIHKSTVSRTIKRFEETETNKNRPKSGRPKTETTEERQVEVAQSFIENHRLSIRKACQQLEMSRFSVYNNLKILKFHPYKLHLVQELNEDDFDRRLEFSEIMMERINANHNFLPLIAFSDEASFELSGNVNRHNFRYWSDENPHWMLEAHTQHPQKLNVWAGLLRGEVIGPFFIDGNLDGARYLQLLEEQIVPAIHEIAGNEFDQVWFQQDGAPPHYRVTVRNYLDDTFHNQWIGRRGSIEWPARSPDLSPLDFFFWGYLKSKVYHTKPKDLLELRQRILDYSADMSPEMIQSAFDNFYVRLGVCQEVNGEHFEHLL